MLGFAVTVAGKKTGGSTVAQVREMYCRYACALLRSMVAELRGLSCPVIVLHDNLSKEQKDRMVKAYPFVNFHHVPLAKFKEHGKADPRYFLLEAFNPIHDLDKIILLGADMICVGQAEALIYRADAPISMWREPAREQWNSGCAVITRPLFTVDNYERVLAEPKKVFGHDQAILNQLFGDIAVPLPGHVQRFVDENVKPPWDCIFLHYIYKPGFAPHKISSEAKALYEKYMPEGTGNLDWKGPGDGA